VGGRLEFVTEDRPGDFIFVPPYMTYWEINTKSNIALECVLMR